MALLDSLNPVTGVVNAVSGAVQGIAKVFVGDKSARDEQDAQFGMSSMGQFASEFTRGQGTWFDSLVDGVNRLPRPAMALGVIGLLAYCPYDPVGFSEIMNAFQLVPDWLALLIGVIAGFYFASRHLEERIKLAGPKPEQIKAYVEGHKMLAELRRTVANEDEPQISDEQFRREMADESTPLSNAAIAEWQRRRAKAA